MDTAKLKEQLIKHEGLRLKPYVDTVGKITVGVGHNLTDLGLTATQVMSILDDDIKVATKLLDTELSWWISLDDVRQRALVDLAFNLGYKLLGFKDTLIALRVNQWNNAADNLLKSVYAKQVGKRAVDLAYMIRTGKDL